MKWVVFLCMVIVSTQIVSVLSAVEDVTRNAEDEELLNFVQLYKAGIEAYLSNEWSQCIDLMEQSISEFRHYYDVVTGCRAECDISAQHTAPLVENDIADLHYYEKVVRVALCMRKCKTKYLPSFPTYFSMSTWAREEFLSRKPYEYLNLCYHKYDEIEKAAIAAFTFLMGNPHDKMMQQNIKYYLTKPNINQNMLHDLEEKLFTKIYLDAIDAYEDDNWSLCIEYMEESLMQFIRNEDECRAFCEGEFDHGYYPDMVSAIGNHFTYTLRCKANCSQQLNFVRGKYHPDVFMSHYEYLQMSYYKVGNLEEACRAASTYLLLNPNSEDAIENIKFYKNQANVKPSFFIPRTEAKRHSLRQKYEKQLLNFVDVEFNKSSETLDLLEEKQNHISSDESKNQMLFSEDNVGQCPASEHENRNLDEELINALYSDPKVRLAHGSGIIINDSTFLLEYYQTYDIAKIIKKNDINKKPFYRNFMKSTLRSESLGRHKRFVIDKIISEEECQLFMDLVEMVAMDGEGYEGNIHPHTQLEAFSGVTVGRLALLTYFGILDTIYLKVMLDVSRRIKEIVEYHFELNKNDVQTGQQKRPLYFTYTQLACRKPMPGAEFNHSTMSHVVHADNCIISPNGTCSPNPPAFIWRDYSAILYINENFDGGDFLFSNDFYGRDVPCLIRPKCGRMIGFSSDETNKHGVKSVKRGIRCSLGIWFTHDAKRKEMDQELAPEVLRKIEQYGTLSDNIGDEIKFGPG